MLEAGVQIVYAYIADAHDNRSGSGTFGPGEPGYVAQLQAYDKAWGQFFARLQAHGINPTNTLFIFTADENDHFVGGAPTPATCDGVTVPCTYVYPNTNPPVRSVGELTANLDSILLTQRGNQTQFLVHADDAPNIYIDGNPKPTDAVTRQLELDLAALTWVNPLPGKTGQVDKLAPYLADQAEMKLLHMVTSSPARTPTLTVFGDPDYFFQTTKGTLPLAPQNCGSNSALCVTQNSAFAWNHGDVQQDITRTWFGMVGPGVRNQGRNDHVFSDHTDLRPTALFLLGLKDDYVLDGRVLVEKLERGVLPHAMISGENDEDNDFVELARVYKQLTAPLGELARKSLLLATRSIEGTDTTYAWFLSEIGPITTQRDQLAAEIKLALDAAEFGNRPIHDFHADVLIARAKALIDKVEDLERQSR
jgi:arylsulfatase A-like enzyme